MNKEENIKEFDFVEDKSDGKKLYYHKFVHNPFSTRRQNSNGEHLLFQFYDLRKAKNDKRQLLLKIIHFPKDAPSHGIELTFDLKSHNNHSPHLNISGLSKSTKCNFCNKYFTENYPNGLDHFPIHFKNSNQSAIKFNSYEIILNDIEQHLHKKGVFNIFNEILYSSDPKNRKIANIKRI